jgi:Helicase associated domain
VEEPFLSDEEVDDEVVVGLLQLQCKEARPSKNPSQWDFSTMFRQLEQWHHLYGSTVVPRHVFDNSDLGQWVCFIRRSVKLGTLEKWKIKQLGLLRFSWKLSKVCPFAPAQLRC